MPSVGSSRISNLGRSTSARERQLLLLIYGQFAAALLSQRIERWKQIEHHLGDDVRFVALTAARQQGDQQVILNAHLREDMAALRHIADPHARALFGRLQQQIARRRAIFLPGH